MQITMMPVKDLEPAPYNPRVKLSPRDPRYRKLRRSLREFGLVEPLVWNRRSGYIVGGHQRLRILRDLGVPHVPVSVVDLPPERERALNVILNNREAQSDWDAGRLTHILEELAATPAFDLRQTGFNQEHLDLLRQRMQPAVRLPMPEPKRPPWIEVILRIPAEQFEQVRPEVDAVLQRHGLESHVRWR